jgi:membrane protease subunit (stomatin/prohibitin family)
MGFWDKLTGEFVDIIEYLEDEGSDVLVHRFERYNNQIKNGAKLTVREGQLAIMVNEGQTGKGQVADVFQPGMYELTTQNLPLLSTMMGWKYGFNSPFVAEVYFFNTRVFTGQKWGTQEEVVITDPKFDDVNVSAHGIYSIRIKDPKVLLAKAAGTQGELTISDLQEELRGNVGMAIGSAMQSSGWPLKKLTGSGLELGKMLRESIQGEFAAFGLELVAVQVQAVSMPDEVREAMAENAAARAVTNMGQYAQHQSVKAMRDAAANPGGAGMMMGLGVGMMGNNMMGGMMPGYGQPMPYGQPGYPQQGYPQQGYPQQQPAYGPPGAPPPMPGAPPPMPGMAPPPLAVPFYVSINGQQAGPFDPATLAQYAAAGHVNRESLVWRTGMAAWTKAGEVPELAGIFGAPPPMPGGPPPMPR